MMLRTAPSPTPLIAARPKRMRPPTTAKSTSDSLTSGGSTVDAHLLRLVDVLDELVGLVSHRSHQRGKILQRMVGLQIRRLIGDPARTRRRATC